MPLKKIVIGLLVAFFFLQVIQPVFVRAAGKVPVVGEDCGVSDSPAEKCCYFDKTSHIQIVPPDLGLISAILNPVFDWVEKAVEKIIGPTLGELNNSYNDTEAPCIQGQASTPGDLSNPDCKCIKKADSPLEALKPFCANISDTGERISCQGCLASNPVGIWTGVGCVKANVESFIQDTLLRWGIGVAGGVSMLCIMYAAFMMQTSGGNAEQVKKAQQLLTACITGLMLIIFSVFILRLIGVNILKIPGFT